MKKIAFLPLCFLIGCVESTVEQQEPVKKPSAQRSIARSTSGPTNGEMLSLRTQPWQNMIDKWGSSGPCRVQYDDQYMKKAVLDHLYPDFDRQTVTLSDFNLLLGGPENAGCAGNIAHNGPGTLMYFVDGTTTEGTKQRKLIWFQTQWINGRVNGYVNLLGFDTRSKAYPNPSAEIRHRIDSVGQFKIETELVPIGENSEAGLSAGLIGGQASFLNGKLQYSVRPQVSTGSLKSQTRKIRIILQLHSSINPLAGTVDVRKYVREVTLSPSNGFTASGSIDVDNVVTGQESRLGPLAIRQKLSEIETSAYFID